MREERRWHVVYIKPRKEKVVETLLKRAGIESFYPIVKLKRNGTLKEEPLFPHYMFANFSLSEYTLVNFTRGVRKVVKFGNNIPYLPEDFIERIKNLSGKVLPLNSKEDSIKTGEIVEIKEGPFRGFIGEVLSVKRGSDRVVVLLKHVNNAPKLELPIEYISLRT